MMRTPMTYCSFATQSRCTGIIILDGEMCGSHAEQACALVGFRPPGDLLAVVVPDDLPERDYLRLLENRNRPLTGVEARELFEAKSVREHQAKDPQWQPGGRAP